MRDGYFHVELGGVKYRLAEDFEGQHYNRSGSPLRPPNAQLVSGTSNLFQSRPDLLIHRWDDWSGGEGLFKANNEEASRYWEGRNIDGFTDKGLLKPGPLMESIQPFAAADEPGALVRVGDKLYLYDQVDETMHPFLGENPPSWLASTFSHFDTQANFGGFPVGDSFAVYYCDASATNYSIERNPESGVDTIINTDIAFLASSVTNAQAVLEVVGNYLYVVDLELNGQGVNVYEVSKNPAAPPAASTLIYDLSDTANDFPQQRAQGTKPASYQTCVTAGPNALYLFTTEGGSTHVHKVTPTSAFSTGYGAEIAVLPGFNAEAMWFHSGYLYFLGQEGDADGSSGPKRMLMYIDLQGAYGVVSDRVGTGYTGHPVGATEASGLTKSRLVMPNAVETNYITVVEVDHRTGAVQKLTEVDATTEADVNGYLTTPHAFQDRLVVGVYGAALGVDNTYVTEPDEPQWAEPCYAVSPWLDNGSTKTKLLSSFTVEFAETWAGTPWTIKVSYRTAVDAAWTLIDSTTDGSSLLWESQVSDSASSVEYQKIQFKVEFDAGGSSTSVWPAITSVQFQSQMTEKFDSWDLLLECTDEDAQAQSRNLRGRDQIDNVQTLGATRVPTAFLDGYTDRDPGLYDTYSVVVDEYRLILERPGEGVAFVRLVEVA